MDIIIRNTGGEPILDQLTQQIKTLILSGALKEGQALPSIRALAKDLRISVITVRRAYEELEQEGFLTNIHGKGCFVAQRSLELVREDARRQVEEHLSEAVEAAHSGGISREEVQEMLEILFEDGPEAQDGKKAQKARDAFWESVSREGEDIWST